MNNDYTDFSLFSDIWSQAGDVNKNTMSKVEDVPVYRMDTDVSFGVSRNRVGHNTQNNSFNYMSKSTMPSSNYNKSLLNSNEDG